MFGVHGYAVHGINTYPEQTPGIAERKGRNGLLALGVWSGRQARTTAGWSQRGHELGWPTVVRHRNHGSAGPSFWSRGRGVRCRWGGGRPVIGLLERGPLVVLWARMRKARARAVIADARRMRAVQGRVCSSKRRWAPSL